MGYGKKNNSIVQIDNKELSEKLAETAQINNNTIIPTFTNGQLTKVEEKDGATVKASSILSYNSDGTVNTITELINGKTVVTTLNYINGEFSNATKAVL